MDVNFLQAVLRNSHGGTEKNHENLIQVPRWDLHIRVRYWQTLHIVGRVPINICKQ
jgi:hypothetical protein